MENRTALSPSRSQVLATNASTSSRVAAALSIAGGAVRLYSTADCYVAFGGSGVAAAAASASLTAHTMFLPAGQVEYFSPPADANWVAAINASASSANLYISEMM